MSTRKRTAAEWPRMKVRGARRRREREVELQVRTVGELFDRVGEAVTDVIEMFAEVGRAWGAILTGAFEQIVEEVGSEQERETREVGEQLGVSEALIDDVIAQTRLYTPCTPTDWAIARANLSALADFTAPGVRS